MRKPLKERQLREFILKWINEHPQDLYPSLLYFCQQYYSNSTNIAQTIYKHIKTVFHYIDIKYNPRITQLPSPIKFKESETIIEEIEITIDELNEEKEFLRRTMEFFDFKKNQQLKYDYDEHEQNRQEILTYLKDNNYSYKKPLLPSFLKDHNYHIVYRMYLQYLILSVNSVIDDIEKLHDFEYDLSDKILQKIRLRDPIIDFKDLSFDFLQNRVNRINKLINSEVVKIEEGTSISFIESRKDQENSFNSVPINKVREIFGVLVTEKNRLSKPTHFIDKTQLEQFIKKAFLGDSSIKKLKIKYNPDLDTVRITHLFYSFRNYSKDYRKKGRKYNNMDYVRLLTDNFLGFDESTVHNNFANKPKDKKTWFLIDIDEVK